MAHEMEIYRPIRNLGISLFAIGCVSTLPLVYLLHAPDVRFRPFLVAAVFAVSHFHILTGLFVVRRREPGFRLLVLYLKFLRRLPALGAAYAGRMLGYIEEHGIKDCFGGRSR